MSWPWSQLGLPGPSDLSQVRHAYAEKLKTTHPEEDPEGFQRLHSAYQQASRMARQRQRQEQTPPTPPPERPPQREAHLEEQERMLRGEESFQPPHEDEEEDFDFDELLQDEEVPPRDREREERQDFDFERLFAEGEAERAEARRRRGEERRKAQERLKAQAQAQERERQKAQEWTQKREQWQRSEQRDTYEQERRSHFDQEQMRWQSTETILHTIEMMYNARTGEEEWKKFFQSPLFQQAKGSIDLIFGLEDFVSTHLDLPQRVRIALFLAYGFDKGVSRPELRPLYQMLLSAWEAEQGKKRQQKLYNVLGFFGGIAVVLVTGIILTSALLPVFLILGGLLLYGLNHGWLKRKPENLNKRKAWLWLLWLVVYGGFTCICYTRGWGLKIPLCVLAVGLAYWVIWKIIHQGRQDEKSGGRPVDKRDDRLLVAFVTACLALGISMFFMPELEKGVSRLALPSDPREQVCRYLEQDFGEKFHSLYNKNSPDSRFDNVFSLKDETSKMFLAGPDGERNKKSGKTGYTTNYPEMMVLWTLKDFAQSHKIYGVDALDRAQGLERWETTATYLISLDFYGDGEIITELGELLEEMSQEKWYQAQPPEVEIVLCGEQMEEGRLILFRYEPSDGEFDAEAVRDLYEASFAHSFCAQLLKEQELDRNFIRGSDSEPYILTNEGIEELRGEKCCKLYGLAEDETVAMEYYVSIKNAGSIYCVPGGFWEDGGTEDDIQFYRVLHKEGGGIISLYYPWLTRY